MTRTDNFGVDFEVGTQEGDTDFAKSMLRKLTS